MGVEVKLKDVRLAFASIFEPSAAKGSTDKKFSAAFIFEPGSENHKALSAAIKEAANEKWGAKAGEVLKTLVAKNNVCLQDGATMAEYDGFDGMKFIRANNKTRPTIIDRDRSPLTQADGKPYSGCYVNAIVEVWAQDNEFGKRINASLGGVQFKRDGDAFAGGRVAEASQFDVEDADDDAGFDNDGNGDGGLL